MTTVLFCSGGGSGGGGDGGGGSFFLCKREITKFNTTRLHSLCASVIFLWSLC